MRGIACTRAPWSLSASSTADATTAATGSEPDSPTPLTPSGFKPTTEYPRVFGVVMDWPIDGTTATIVSALDGSASLYTTGTFGIIGGSGHESVRMAAQRFVRTAEAHHDEALRTRAYPYPAKGKVRFYFRTFQDVRVIETDAASAYSPSGRYSGLFRAGQAVLTELRKVVEARR